MSQIDIIIYFNVTLDDVDTWCQSNWSPVTNAPMTRPGFIRDPSDGARRSRNFRHHLIGVYEPSDFSDCILIF